MPPVKIWSAPSPNLSGTARADRSRRPFRRRLAESELYTYALTSLGRRAHSSAELRQRLARRALEPAAVERIVARLTDAGLLDDRRFALLFSGYHAGAKRHGRYRIARELRRRGVAEELIAAALAETFPEEQDEVELVRMRLGRRLRRYRPPYSEKVLRSAYQSLLRAGFSSAIIRRELDRRRQKPLDDEFLEEDAASQ